MLQIPNSSTFFLRGLCVVLPAATLAAAHWFPWRSHLRRDLRLLERYAIGTAAITGTAHVAITHSDGDRNEHAHLLLLAAASAGTVTGIAYLLDYVAGLRSHQAGAAAQKEFLRDYDNL